MPKCFYAKRYLLKPHERRLAAILQQNQLRSTEDLQEWNLIHRRKIVECAFNRIPFYQRKFSAFGFELGDMSDPDFFSKLPILEKEEIRENERDMVDPAFRNRKLPASTTGGSTGTPLRTLNDPRIPAAVLSWRMLNWWGVDVSDNSGYLYRAVPDGWRKAVQQIVLWPTRRAWISAANMSPERMEYFYRALARTNPRYLVGYVGAIDVFASFLEDRGYSLPSLQAVWTTSAPLPRIKREYVEHILGCKVYTQYGSCEFYWIAAECAEQRGMHIANDARHVEIVDGDRNLPCGEFGDIVVTDLLNHAFPLIRYRLGDQGHLLKEDCPCGLPFPLMDYVRGRITDTIWTREGIAIPGEYWTTIFDDYPETVKSFQVHQHADYSVTVRYEPRKGADIHPVLATVAGRIQSLYGSALALRFESALIEVNDNGKTRFVVSEVVR